MSKGKREPEFIVQNGKPVAVILDIDDYRQMLERLEDTHDLQQLDEMREEGLQFRSLDEFLKEQDAGV